jgi:predicted RNA-binding protein with RPS1 domain
MLTYLLYCHYSHCSQIADFGAFVDFGAHNDGLLHTSKLGPLRLQNLLIGQQIGVDILSVNGNQVSLGLAGLGLQPDPPREAPRKPTSSKNPRKKPEPKGSAKRSISTQPRARGSQSKQPADKVSGNKRSISTSRADARPSKKSRKGP